MIGQNHTGYDKNINILTITIPHMAMDPENHMFFKHDQSSDPQIGMKPKQTPVYSH